MVGSTNEELLQKSASGAPEGTVLIAERQLAGRGRLGRRWLDHPGGSVLCSVLFRPPFEPRWWYLAPWVVALAASKAALETTAVRCRLKWPNDLLAGEGGRKVAGVLSETSGEGGLVVGIGINCNWPPEFPPAGSAEAAAIAATATSLDRVAGAPVDREALVARMLELVAEAWTRLLAGGPAPDPGAVAELCSRYRDSSSTIGELVRVEMAGEAVTGRALDVDDQGRLVVESATGARPIDVGDVVHLRSGAGAGAD